jgi:galactose mutarotase-like enzyme
VFDITSQQERYLTYTLSDTESQSALKVVPSRGGIITQWQLKGKDILYLDKERFQDPQLSIRGGIPILFPICGNLPENNYSYNLQTYHLKQHGFARDLPWKVIDRHLDGQASITLSLQSNEETLAVYPFEFSLVFTYTLVGNSLKIQQHYTNNSSVKMPFSTGLHPYFVAGDKSQLEFIIPASSYQNQISKEIKPFEGNFDFSEAEIDVAFGNITEKRSEICDRSCKQKISLTYSNAYSTLVFWTIAHKDYICLEPWTAPRNALNTGESLLYLKPKTSYETWVQIEVNEF